MQNLLSFIYKNELGDSTNKGLSSKHTDLPVYYGDIDVEFLMNLKEDGLLHIKRKMFGECADYIVPVSVYLSGKHSMFGGNFAYTSHSGFPSNAPIKIHDRLER